MNKKILALAVVILALPTAPMAASVYKWTDENGVTHFGDRKPMDAESESVDVRTGRSPSSSSKSDSAQLPDPSTETDEPMAAQDSNVRAVEAARQKQMTANCETARNNLNLLNTGSRVKVTENGEERFLTPNEIEQKKQQFKTIADQNCTN